SKSVPDALDPDDSMIGPNGLGKFSIGTNRDGSSEMTWEDHNFGPLGKAKQFFGVVAVDNAGNVYQAAAGGYAGALDDGQPEGTVLPTQDNAGPTDQEFHDGEVTFTYYERSTGRTNPQKVVIPTPDGDAMWPWVIAGDDGRVAVVWYQRLASEPNHFYIYAAITDNAHGEVKCENGTTKREEPKFTVVNVSQRPVH